METKEKAKSLLEQMSEINKNCNAPAKCHNCKYSSVGFKIAGTTHHQCNHPKHKEGFNRGKLCAWDTLQEWYNSCESHEFKIALQFSK